MTNVYVLSFERPLSFDFMLFHRQLTSLPAVQDWWKYLSSTYLLFSPLSAHQLSNQIRPLLAGGLFIVIEVNPRNYDGWLQKEAWDWIEQQKNKSLP